MRCVPSCSHVNHAKGGNNVPVVPDHLEAYHVVHSCWISLTYVPKDIMPHGASCVLGVVTQITTYVVIAYTIAPNKNKRTWSGVCTLTPIEWSWNLPMASLTPLIWHVMIQHFHYTTCFLSTKISSVDVPQYNNCDVRNTTFEAQYVMW